MKNNAILPAQWADYLHKQPETGMDYHIVSITLDDGTQVDDVAIIHSHIIGEIRGHPDMIIDPSRIAGVKVTHNKWPFRKTI